MLGSRISVLESWFEKHPGVYDGLKRDELRTLYRTLGDEAKSIQQSDIILANQLNDEKTLLLLSEVATENDSTASANQLQLIASRFPQFQYVRAASLTRAAELVANRGQTKAAMAIYRQALSGPAPYADLAKRKYLKLKGTQFGKTGHSSANLPRGKT